MAVAGCADDDEHPPRAAEHDPNAPGEVVATQGSVTWRECGRLECASLEVPLDPDVNNGDTLGLALARLSPSTEALGTIVLNPGGPGGSGLELLHQLAQVDLASPLARYNLVSFDPRGVGQSGGQDCFGPDLEFETAEGADSDAVLLAIAKAGDECAAAYGPLFEHLGSNAVVADMEQLRRALGEEKLNFLGISYGTRLGALYHMRFPERVGHLVLDAAMPPAPSRLELVKGQAEGTEAALARFFQICVDDFAEVCPEAPRATFDAMRASAREGELLLDAEPLPEAALLAVWRLLLPQPDAYELLVATLDDYADDRGTELLRVLLELFEGTTSASKGLAEVNVSVLCADDPMSALSADEISAAQQELELLSPTFGEAFGSGLDICAAWPVPSDPIPALGDRNAAPFLIIGGSADPSTPLRFAEAMAAEFPSARLLVSHHIGHSVSLSDDDCVDSVLERFFASGDLPPPGTECGSVL